MPEDRRNSSTPRIVISNQPELHPRLEEVVARHQAHTWRQPIREHNQSIFDQYRTELRSQEFIIDAGCGTGQSSLWLAAKYPDKLVLGIDRSDDRLSRKKQNLPSNLRFIRADLEDWWRLTQAAGLQAYKQTILYPNPYPKAAQLQRRWHAHPVLPALIACGSDIEIRSNWETYIREAQRAFAMHLPSHMQAKMSVPSEVPVTAFERKYIAAGQPVYQLTTCPA